MNRRRPFLRRWCTPGVIALTLTSLLAGGALTTAVAWRSASAFDSSSAGTAEVSGVFVVNRAGEHWVGMIKGARACTSVYSWPTGTSPDHERAGLAARYGEQRPPAWCLAANPDPAAWLAARGQSSQIFWTDAAFGWPARALAFRHADRAWGISPAVWYALDRGGPGLGRFLPLRPVWPGFLINSVLGAIVVAPLFAAVWHTPRALRRWRRRSRGLCPRCAYDLTGLASGTCPECGSPVSRSA